MIYFISDTHFGHSAMIKFGRPFKDVHEMDKTIIKNWNDTVKDNDLVYITGDFWYKGDTPATVYLTRLKGRKILLKGNHDDIWINESDALFYLEKIESYFEYEENELAFNLCHYPMLDWYGGREGRYLIHGHTHSATFINKIDKFYDILKEIPNALNACVDINQFRPVTLEQLISNNKKFYKRK